MNVPTLTVAGTDLFTTSFNGFTQTGWYRVVAYAQDVEQHLAVPQSMRVSVGCSFVYLPLVRKSNCVMTFEIAASCMREN